MELPKRKPIRLKNWDYSKNGYYFVTICTYNKKYLLGNIDVGQGLCPCREELPVCRLSPIGQIAADEWVALKKKFQNIKLDHFVVMPNHIHGILIIERQGQSPCPTIGDVLRAYKSITTKKCNQLDGVTGRKIWQFRYHDHVIRGEQDYKEIWQYIDENPLKWKLDKYYCE